MHATPDRTAHRTLVDRIAGAVAAVEVPVRLTVPQLAALGASAAATLADLAADGTTDADLEAALARIRDAVHGAPGPVGLTDDLVRDAVAAGVTDADVLARFAVQPLRDPAPYETPAERAAAERQLGDLARAAREGEGAAEDVTAEDFDRPVAAGVAAPARYCVGCGQRFGGDGHHPYCPVDAGDAAALAAQADHDRCEAQLRARSGRPGGW